MTEPKYQRVVDELRRRIEIGEAVAGTRLPGVRPLAEEFGVSTITTTHALNELERLGYVERRERSGTYVRETRSVLDSVVLVVSTGLESAGTACIDYWRGVSSSAESWGVPVRLVRGEDSRLPSLVLRRPDRRIGYVGVMTSPGAELMRRIVSADAPYVSLGVEDLDCRFCVTEDRRRACHALVEQMAADGCRRFGFIGNPRASNHVLARVAFADTVQRICGTEGEIRDADDRSASAVVRGLLSDVPSLDGVVIMGGNMPVAALPSVLGCGRSVAVGVMSENSTVLQLRSMAYVASYSQESSGRLAFDTLRRLALGELSGSATLYTPFEVLRPGS